MPAPLAHEPETAQRVTQLTGGSARALAAAGAKHDLYCDNREPGGLNFGRDRVEQALEPGVKQGRQFMPQYAPH
jgi:hypothetical protein